MDVLRDDYRRQRLIRSMLRLNTYEIVRKLGKPPVEKILISTGSIREAITGHFQLMPDLHPNSVRRMEWQPIFNKEAGRNMSRRI